MSFLFTLILIAISGYVLYSAFTGKGRLYSIDNIIEEKIPLFRKILKPLYLTLGVILLLMACTSAYQNIVYSDVTYQFGKDFPVYFSDRVDAEGNILDQNGKATSIRLDGIYTYNEMTSVFSTLEQPQVPEGVTPVYAEAARDASGNILYLGLGESTPGQNGTYTRLRSVFSYRTTQILTYIFMGIALALVIGLFIVMNRFTDKEKAAKAKAKAKSAGASLPSDAFEFKDSDSDNEQ